jgi:hypothetical protein
LIDQIKSFEMKKKGGREMEKTIAEEFQVT